MYKCVKVGKTTAMINLDRVSFIEPYKDDANKSFIQFEPGLFLISGTPYKDLQMALALNGVMQ